MKIGKYNIRTLYVVSFIIIAVIFIISLVMYNINTDGNRRIFYFESLDESGLFSEVRYIVPYSKEQSVEDDIYQFVNELLLGPITHRYKAVFAKGTSLNTCILRNEILYVDISSQALFPTEIDSFIQMGVQVFEKNILKNFSEVKEVVLYIDGIQTFQNLTENIKESDWMKTVWL